MQSVVWTFVERMINETEKKVWSFSEKTMKSERENDVWRAQ